MPFGSEARFDFSDIDGTGRRAENKVEGQSYGFALKHALVDVLRAPDTTFSLEGEYRLAYAKGYSLDSSVTPPPARVYLAHVDASSWLAKDRFVFHARGTVARLTVGEVLDGWSAGAVVGGDFVLGQGFTLRGNAGVYQSYGDVRTTAFPFTGGFHFGPRLGFFSDLSATLWPRGVEMIDGPLADMAVFRLEPILRNQQAYKNLRDSVVGVLTFQLGYRAEF